MPFDSPAAGVCTRGRVRKNDSLMSADAIRFEVKFYTVAFMACYSRLRNTTSRNEVLERSRV